MQTKKRSNQMIEVFRGILPLLIVFCHFNVAEPANLYIVGIARCAVPFFLILSGFYAYSGNREKDLAHIKKKMIDMLKLILRVAVIYTVVNTVVCLINKEAPFFWFAEKYMTTEALRNFLLFNRARFFASIAYYLFMVLYVLVIYWLIVKLNIVSVSFIFIPILLAGNLYLSEFLKKDWFIAGNWMLTGIPFFLLGVFLRKKAFAPKRKWCVCLMAVGFVSTLVEAYIHQFSDVYVYVGTILLSAGIFLFCKTYENEPVCTALAKFGSNFSTGMFLYHCAVGYVLKALFNIIGLPVNSVFPFVVIAVTIAVILLCNGLKKAFSHNR